MTADRDEDIEVGETGGESRAELEKADVRVFLGGVGSERRFVVQNIGPAKARDVRLSIESEEGKNSPIVEGELEKKFPAAELAVAAAVSLQAIITTGTGIHFTATVSWQDPDGSRQERSHHLAP
jgi:hypothetical protein